jgi:hypothetical protein
MTAMEKIVFVFESLAASVRDDKREGGHDRPVTLGYLSFLLNSIARNLEPDERAALEVVRKVKESV